MIAAQMPAGLTVREAESDEDLEAWRQVRIAVLPNERCETVEWMRRTMTPERVYLVAELDGRLAGSGLGGRSDFGYAGLHPRVLPWARHRGVGTALLLELAERATRLGFGEAGTNVDDAGSLAFARCFGYDPLALQAFEDMALDRPVLATLEQWERDWLAWPEATFVALADGEIVGTAGLQRDADQPERAESALTAVRRGWRGRGIASALKRMTLAFVAANGIREVYTWTQQGNADMRRLNERLGYVDRGVSISVRAALPLAGP